MLIAISNAPRTMRALDSPKPPPSRAVRARSRHVATPHARPYGAMRTRAPHQRRVIRTVVVTRGRRRVVNPRHAPTARTRAHRLHHSNVPSCPRGARVRVTKPSSRVRRTVPYRSPRTYLDAMRANVREACASSWNAARDARERSDSRFELLT